MMMETLKERLDYELSINPENGICGLFPDRMGFYQLCKRTRNPGRTGTRFRRGE